MGPHVPEQRTALLMPITVSAGDFKTGYANWRFQPRFWLKKLPWLSDARRHIAAKSLTTKSVVLSQGTDSSGVTRPFVSLAGWGRDIRAANATVRKDHIRRPRPLRRQELVGAPSDCTITVRGKGTRASQLRVCLWRGTNGLGELRLSQMDA